MKRAAIIIGLLILISSIPYLTSAIETAPRITDREIVERLTKIEEGQKALRTEIDVRFKVVETKFDSIENGMKQLREDMNTQGRQLREDMNTQFNRIDSQFNRMAAIFTALVVSIIGFAIWDRRTMIRPFETRVKDI